MRIIALATLLLAACTLTAAELRAPDEASIDSRVAVEIVGEVDPKAFVSIVAPDTREGAYGKYAYTRQARVEIPAPDSAGDYEVRLHGATAPYPTLARRAIRIVLPTASLEAPEERPVGVEFAIAWSGPSGANEYITLVPISTADGQYGDYQYARGEGSGTVTLTTPTEPGDYEIRYMTGARNKVIARRPLRVADGGFSVTASASVVMGARFEASWRGAANDRNYLTVVTPDSAPRDYDDYAYTTSATVSLVAPEVAGDYEVRLVSADNTRVLASTPIVVSAAQATVQGPRSVVAGTVFEARWTGPGNELDYIAVTAVGKPKDYQGYTYTHRGSPLSLRAPKAPGDYELHYLTGRGNVSLARQALQVTPAPTPGSLRVVRADGQPAGGSTVAVELILDASGSMLQRLDGERRIDIARAALAQLIQNELPEGTTVALRVFGHRKPDACDSELLTPLAPLNRAALSATVRNIEAKNLAKTPIGASLAAVADDLAGVEGAALVVLVTDGEETCGGDPAAEIAKLRQSGFAIALNIVGFAIDEFALEQEFRDWASLGGGAYFAATDADALARSIAQAAKPSVFSVKRDGVPVASGVVGGEAVALPPGRYEVISAQRRWPAEVKAEEETVLTWE